MVKTQSSLSNDPTLRGRPEGFELTVNGMVVAADAGYVVPILGNMRRMLGLPAKPQAERMNLIDGHRNWSHLVFRRLRVTTPASRRTHR